jgi:hypothetical protein
MMEKTQNLLKKFERDYEMSVGATDALTYWIVYARIPNPPGDDVHHMHHGKKYVSGPNQNGNVLIFPEPMMSDAYLVESWGEMESFDDFVIKALASILADKKMVDAGQNDRCGTCG